MIVTTINTGVKATYKQIFIVAWAGDKGGKWFVLCNGFEEAMETANRMMTITSNAVWVTVAVDVLKRGE